MELLERFVPLFVAVLTAVTPIVLTIHSSGRKDRAQGKENSEKLYAIRNEMHKDDVKPAQYDQSCTLVPQQLSRNPRWLTGTVAFFGLYMAKTRARRGPLWMT